MQSTTEYMDASISPHTENINMGKFTGEIHKIQSSLSHFIDFPDHLPGLVKTLKCGEQIVGIGISTNTEGTYDKAFRIRFKDPNSGQICGTLDCFDYIKRNFKTGLVKQTGFSFHFNPCSSNQNLRSFRIDFDQDALTSLHAHNDSYHIDNEAHLSYPNDIALNLYYIDFCTIMHIIVQYIQQPDKYPLEHGELYNPIIVKIRSRYNEQ